jgi:hypothetical protein
MVKGSAGLWEYKVPATVAAMAKEAVLAVVYKPWRRPISRLSAPWVKYDEIEGTLSAEKIDSNEPVINITTLL